jgi:hypothetical protein
MDMHQNIAEECEARERLRWAVTQLGYPRTVRALASIAYEDAQRHLQAGDRLRAARYAYTFDVLLQVVATLPDERIPG